MKAIYEKFKGKTVTYADGVSGAICGYTNDNLLMALENCKSAYCFRKFGKEEHYIEDKYTDSKYKYTYCSEKDAEKSEG